MQKRKVEGRAAKLVKMAHSARGARPDMEGTVRKVKFFPLSQMLYGSQILGCLGCFFPYFSFFYWRDVPSRERCSQLGGDYESTKHSPEFVLTTAHNFG